MTTTSEFKAWFAGFTEFMPGAPTEKQWARIKERVAEIDGKPVTQTVFVDRYVERYPYWRPYWGMNDISIGSYSSALQGSMGGQAVNCGVAELTGNHQVAIGMDQGVEVAFNSLLAMGELGAAEFKEMMQ